MRKLSLLAVTVAICWSSAPVDAALLNSLVKVGVRNTIQDTDFERLIKGANNTQTDVIEEGDTLEAILLFDTANSTTLKNQFGADYQLTAHSRITVTSITETGGGLANFTFTNGFGDGTAIRLYENPNASSSELFNSQVDPANGIARATSGQLLTTFGLDATEDDFWFAEDAPINIAVFADPDADPLLQGGDFFFGLSVVDNPGGLAILTEEEGGGIRTSITGAPTVHDLVGNGTLKIPDEGTNAGWDAQTDTTAHFVGVPEPSSIALLTLGGLGCLGGTLRRRRSEKSTTVA